MNTYFVKDSEIEEKSIIMIDFDNSKESQPFWVESKSKLPHEGVTVLYGEKLNKLIEKMLIISNYGARLFISNTDKNIPIKNAGIKGFRKITSEEKTEWIEKVKLISQLKDLVQMIKES